MADTIHVSLRTRPPEVAATLSELRYLVCQGLKGDPGERGTTLGWDVEDDGAGNVSMTYPDDALDGVYAVRYLTSSDFKFEAVDMSE